MLSGCGEYVGMAFLRYLEADVRKYVRLLLLPASNQRRRNNFDPSSLVVRWRSVKPRRGPRCMHNSQARAARCRVNRHSRLPAARFASQRAVPLEGLGEEEQGTRAAPDDLLTSYPGTGRKSALLGRVRTCQGACLVSSPTLAVREHSTSPHPDPALTLGWSVHHARRGIRTTAPGSCAEGRFQDRRRLISEARPENHISPRPSCSVPIHPQPKKLIPGLSSARG